MGLVICSCNETNVDSPFYKVRDAVYVQIMLFESFHRTSPYQRSAW